MFVHTRSLGQSELIEGQVDKIPEFDPRSGDHYWILILTYKWDKKTVETILDHENLVLTLPPGCYYCEEPYSERLAKRRCKGHS